MVLYLVIIAVCVAAIAGMNAAIWDASFWVMLAWTSGITVVVIVIDGATAGITRLCPAKWFPIEHKFYDVGKKEKRFYEKIKIRFWKDKIPEIGHFTGFRKNKLDNPKSVEYVERFMLESCYGEIGHIISCFTGFLIMIPFPFMPNEWWCISLPVAIVNLLLNMPSIFVLRYNYYKLAILRKSHLKKKQREEMANVAA